MSIIDPGYNRVSTTVVAYNPPRIIVQISSSSDAEGKDTVVHALCNDGTVWSNTARYGMYTEAWKPLPPIPKGVV